MSNRRRVIQFLNDIINERQEETNVRTFAAHQVVTNLQTFAAGVPTNFYVQALSPGSVTIQGKGAVSYQIQNPIALVPVIDRLGTKIAYHDFSNVNPNAQYVSSTIKTVETQLFSTTFWQEYLRNLKSSLSANFQTLELDRGVILKDSNGRPILLPSFVYVEIVKGPSFFKSAETAAMTGSIREGGGAYTVTMFPANFAQLARLAFTNTAIRQGDQVFLLSPVAAFEEALRRATRSIGEVAKPGGKDTEKKNMAGALMPGTDESVEVARAVAIAALAKALRDNAKNFKVVQFQITPDAEGRLSQQDWKALVDNLTTVYRMVLGALGSAVNMFTEWANSSIVSAQYEALVGLSGKAPDVWPAARVSEPAKITVTESGGSWTVKADVGTLASATAEAKYRPIPALVERSSMVRAREGGGAVFTTIADTLLYSLNAIGHNWDLVPQVLAAFNQKWKVWKDLPSFFDASGKLRPLSELMSYLAAGLIQKRAALERSPNLEEFESEVAVIMHYISTLYGENTTLVALQNLDQDIKRLSKLSTFQLDPIVRNALDALKSTFDISNLVRYIPTLETLPSISTTPWELPVIEEQPETGAGTAGLELTPQ